MSEQFYDLKFERLEDGTIRMEQRADCETYIVDAHPAQLIHIARFLVGARVSPEVIRIATLERRLLWLRDRFGEALAVLPSDFYDNCRDWQEFDAWLDASVTVAKEYCADLTLENKAASPKADGP